MDGVIGRAPTAAGIVPPGLSLNFPTLPNIKNPAGRSVNGIAVPKNAGKPIAYRSAPIPVTAGRSVFRRFPETGMNHREPVPAAWFRETTAAKQAGDSARNAGVSLSS